MSDMIDMYRDLASIRAAQRKVFGVSCLVCREKLPKAQPKILQPGQWCRAHKPHFRDPREEPPVAEYNERMAAAGYDIRRLEGPAA
jgi:hypothetical protein